MRIYTCIHVCTWAPTCTLVPWSACGVRLLGMPQAAEAGRHSLCHCCSMRNSRVHLMMAEVMQAWLMEHCSRLVPLHGDTVLRGPRGAGGPGAQCSPSQSEGPRVSSDSAESRVVPCEAGVEEIPSGVPGSPFPVLGGLCTDGRRLEQLRRGQLQATSLSSCCELWPVAQPELCRSGVLSWLTTPVVHRTSCSADGPLGKVTLIVCHMIT